jgi:hypothetical protein
MKPAERAGSGRGDPTVHQDQLKPPGDGLAGQMLQHQLAGTVLVGGGRYDQCTHRKPGHVDGHDALGALGAAVGSAAVLGGEPAVGHPSGQVGVDHHHRRRHVGATVDLAGGLRAAR